MGKDCAYPSVVLVLVCSLPDHGHVFACLSVVLVLVCSLPDVGMRIRPLGKCHGDSSVAVFAGGRCPCSVLSCSDDSTGAVLGSVDDVPVVVQRQVQGQTAH